MAIKYARNVETASIPSKLALVKNDGSVTQSNVTGVTRSNVSADSPPFRPYKDGKGYSPRTSLYQHSCFWCGKEFAGSLDKAFCSDACRVSAWRDGKRAFGIPTETTVKPAQKLRILSWGKRRFAVLQRDGFKCVYCGRGAKQNVVLHVDHVHPKSKGGLDDMDNLVTACQECNLAKQAEVLTCAIPM